MPESTAIKSKIQSSRLNLGGFEDFKKAKEQERNPVEKSASPHEEPVQVEADFDSPPADEVAETSVPLAADLGKLLKDGWMEFAGQCSPRISSLMKTVNIRLNGTEAVAETGSSSQTGALEEIRIEFVRFITKYSGGKIASLKFEQVQATEGNARKPYTEKEKLEFLINKNPKLKETIERLNLRIV